MGIRVMPARAERIKLMTAVRWPACKEPAEPIGSAQGDRPDLVFHPIVINYERTFIEIARNRLPSLQSVIVRFSYGRSIRH